jgi:ParB family chromosome partitioning protein
MAQEKNVLKRAMHLKPITQNIDDVQEYDESKDTWRIPRTGPGVFATHLAENDLVRIENAQLKDTLAQWTDALVTKKLDPKLIRASKWANRDEDSFLCQDFLDFKSEIDSSVGNIQPIKVRPIVGASKSDDPLAPKYEIVYGHRRYRACLELGLPVLALIDSVSEVNLFIEMDRENRQRADLRPIEQGRMYKNALAEGLFPSLRKLCDSISVDLGNASKYIALANLPQEVIDAFEKSGDLQKSWASDLTKAVREHLESVLTKARLIRLAIPRLPAKKVFEQLTQIDMDLPVSEMQSTQHKKEITLSGVGKQSAKIRLDPAKGLYVIRLEHVDADRLSQVEQAIQTLIS